MSDEKWYYAVGDKQEGPISVGAVRAMLEAGTLDANTQVWREGFGDWQALGRVEELHGFYPTLSPPPLQRKDLSEVPSSAPILSGPQIRPWTRYFARMMDIFLFAIIAGTLLGIFYPQALKMNDTLLGIIILFVYVFVEPIMLTWWGATPGKGLLRIRLRTLADAKPGFGEALNRSFKVWLKGLGLGIPLISLITLITAFNHLTKNSITTWDEEGGFIVSHQSIGPGRVIVVVLLSLGFVFLMALGESEI